VPTPRIVLRPLRIRLGTRRVECRLLPSVDEPSPNLTDGTSVEEVFYDFLMCGIR